MEVIATLQSSDHSRCQRTQKDGDTSSSAADGTRSTAEDTTGKFTSGLNGTLHEARTASVCNSFVERGLGRQDGRLGEARCVRGARFPADEGGEGQTDAGSAELRFGSIRFVPEEDDVVVTDGIGVGSEDGL